MKPSVKWLWMITCASLIATVFLVLVLFWLMMGLAIIAPEIPPWPLFTALGMSAPLSLAGLIMVRKVAPSRSLILYAINGCGLALNLLVIGSIAAIVIGETKEQFLIPEGYKGDVYVVYGKENCEPLTVQEGWVTYRIPRNGILRVCATLDHGWTKTYYYYEAPNGVRQPIRGFWPTTIHPTADNLGNDSEFGVYFPRGGRTTVSPGCSVEFQRFYVGTKHHFLTTYSPMTAYDFNEYLREHPVGCQTKETSALLKDKCRVPRFGDQSPCPKGTGLELIANR